MSNRILGIILSTVLAITVGAYCGIKSDDVAIGILATVLISAIITPICATCGTSRDKKYGKIIIKIESKRDKVILSSILLVLVLSIIFGFIIYNEVTKDVFDKLNKKSVTTLEGSSGKYTKLNDSVCSAFKNVIAVYDKYFLTWDNENGTRAYEYDLVNIIDNNQNCKFIKKISDEREQAIISLPSIIQYDYRKAVYVTLPYKSNNTIEYYIGGPPISFYEMISLTENVSSSKMAFYTFDSLEEYSKTHNERKLKTYAGPVYQMAGTTVVKGDKNRYYKVEVRKDWHSFITEVTDEVIFIPKEETVEIIADKAIVTSDNVYIYANKDPLCHNYVNANCEKKFIINEDLTRRINEIVFIDNSYVVFKDGSTYLYENY